MSMGPRERVAATLAFRKADRVPRRDVFEGALSKETAGVLLSEKYGLDLLAFEPADDDARFADLMPALPERRAREALFAGVLGLFLSCQNLRGVPPFAMDTAEDIPFCRALADRLAPFAADMAVAAITRCGAADIPVAHYEAYYDAVSAWDRRW